MCWSYDIDTPDATTTLEIIGLPEYPTPPGGRDLSDEYEDILQTELEYAPLIFEMEKNMQPAYAQLAYETQKRLLTMPGGQLDLAQRIQPQVSTTDAAYTTAQREADITDVENLGARAVAAYEESTPELQSLLDASTQAALNPLESDISQELERQAYDQLTSAGYLTEPELRSAEQAARAAYSDRGLIMSNPAMAEEVLMTDALSRQRQMEAQQYAMQVEQMRLGRVGQEQNQLTQAAQLRAGTTVDPYAAVTGRAVTAPQQAASAQALAGSFLGSGPQYYDPAQNQYASQLYSQNSANEMAAYQTQYQGAMDVWGTQAQAQMNAIYAPANMEAAMYGSTMGALGSIGGGLMTGVGSMLCWVAREVYGISNPKWRVFRDWMLTRSPRWFRALYCGYGDMFAKWIHNKPRLKARIRRWMDSRIRSHSWQVT